MAEEFKSGLEGVIAFESEIAEPDKEGGSLRYRGVDIEDLVGKVTFGNVWALLVDGKFGPGLPPAEPFPIPVHTGDVRVDVQAALAMLTPIWGYQPLLDISPEEARDEVVGHLACSSARWCVVRSPAHDSRQLRRSPPDGCSRAADGRTGLDRPPSADRRGGDSMRSCPS